MNDEINTQMAEAHLALEAPKAIEVPAQPQEEPEVFVQTSENVGREVPPT